MENHKLQEIDYGAGEKKLSIYIVGMIGCILLTVLSFWVVMANQFNRLAIYAIIFASAVLQFLIQVVCFLRLNTQTNKARTNVMSFVFTLVILLVIVFSSLWIMSNLNYYMSNH